MSNFKIIFINKKNLNEFINGECTEDEFIFLLYIHGHKVDGFDHSDTFKKQVIVHHRNRPGGFIVRGTENFEEYECKGITSDI